MRKQLEDFLINITDFYPISSNKNYNNVIAQSVDYLMEFCCGKEIDFKKARNYIFDNYKFKGFPDLALLKESLLNSEVIKFKHCEDEGGLVVVTLPTGKIFTFEISAFGKSLDDIKKQVVSNYGNVQIRTYPKGTVMIGTTIIQPE